ncbi:uncharacterized protein LOC126264361 isoform X2 [Aethina tumida]|uniref:uncharacterized protein LOC126264361 isoform X2 n=1 Tax=Aethina tumida TaxID=116153 RepID=UPI002147DBC6|nr:uncharacterized protein LOC126264361 isoform X2 [Aethina tumida]
MCDLVTIVSTDSEDGSSGNSNVSEELNMKTIIKRPELNAYNSIRIIRQNSEVDGYSSMEEEEEEEEDEFSSSSSLEINLTDIENDALRTQNDDPISLIDQNLLNKFSAVTTSDTVCSVKKKKKRKNKRARAAARAKTFDMQVQGTGPRMSGRKQGTS